MPERYGILKRKVRAKENSRKSVRWSAVPVPCLSRLCLKLREGAGQRLQRGQWLILSHVRGIFSFTCILVFGLWSLVFEILRGRVVRDRMAKAVFTWNGWSVFSSSEFRVLVVDKRADRESFRPQMGRPGPTIKFSGALVTHFIIYLRDWW